MATKKTKDSLVVTPASLSPSQSIEILNRQRDKASELLKNRPLTDDAYTAWETLTENYLIKTFGSASSNIRKVMDIGHYGSFPMSAGDEWWEHHRRKSLTSQIASIDSLI